MEGERSLWVDQFERFDDFVCGVLDVRREDSRIVIRAEVVQAEGENKVIDLDLHCLVVQHGFVLPLVNQDIPREGLAKELVFIITSLFNVNTYTIYIRGKQDATIGTPLRRQFYSFDPDRIPHHAVITIRKTARTNPITVFTVKLCSKILPIRNINITIPITTPVAIHPRRVVTLREAPVRRRMNVKRIKLNNPIEVENKITCSELSPMDL